MDKIPYGASYLVDLRANGLVPELPVIVSLVGGLRFTNLTLQAKPSERYGWRAIGALEVEVFASTKVPFGELLRTLADIASAVPRRMVLTFVEGPRVECGEMRVLQDFALFDWFPIAIGPTAWEAATKLAQRLCDELGHRLPIPYEQAVPLVLEDMKKNEEISCG